MFTYDIASREVAYRVLSSQRDGAEHDEDQDEVGEDLMVDQLMAEYTKSKVKNKEGDTERERGRECTVRVNSKSSFVTYI